MVTEYAAGDGAGVSSSRPMVDPRAPRFGQALTASGLLLGIVLDVPALIYAVALVLVTAVLSQWQVDAWGILFKTLVKPVLGHAPPESATPHRFAKVVGAVGTTLASVLLVAGFPIAGYGVAVLIVIPAGLGATTGFCLGCHMYRQVSLFRRLSIV